jgi:ketosteroid isomerase-like protein/pimeloyl-ACP methyl ester carboxylesterase
MRLPGGGICLRLVGFVGLVLLCAGTAAGQNRPDAGELAELRSRLGAAESAGDLTALAELYSPDIVFQTHETAPVVGLDAVLGLWQYFLGQVTLTSSYSSSGVELVGDRVVDRGTVVLEYTTRDSGETSAETLHYALQLARSRAGEWRIVSVLLSDVAGAELRVPSLPAPTGPRAIGSMGIQAVDSSRLELPGGEPLSGETGKFRTVTAQVWYPALPRVTEGAGVSARPESYRSRDMTRAAAEYLGWPIFFNSFFELVDTHSHPGAPPDRSGAPYPVVLYHHGYGGFTRVHTALIEDLVSRGFVVASVGHAYETPFLERPDGSLVRFGPENPVYVGRLEEAHGETQEALKDRVVEAPTTEEQERAYRELLAASPLHQESTRAWAADGSFVLDRLAVLDESDGPLGGMVDLTRVGVVGHSLGGAAAGQAASEDARVIAGIDLDGFMFGDLIDRDTDAAFMFVSAARPWAGVGGSALTLFFERHAGPAYLVRIDGFEHGTFSDLPLFTGAWPGEGGEQDGVRALAVQRAYVGAFFGRHLQGIETDLLDGPAPEYPEVSIRSRRVEH